MDDVPEKKGDEFVQEMLQLGLVRGPFGPVPEFIGLIEKLAVLQGMAFGIGIPDFIEDLFLPGEMIPGGVQER